ncbi:MAG: T9SS type A sorting domain-containing protein, partial [Chitinophagaceae bacterium]|nr:T9SS type A sorting domain-containing protein [Chitinophagaceae bacterium]
VHQIGSVASGVTGTPFRGNAASGSCWYSGNMFPASYKNTYFQADYGGTWLKNFTIQYTDQITKVTNFASGFAAIVCVTENPLDGSIVVVDIGTGEVKKIKYGGNQSPVVVLSSNRTFGPSSLAVNFTGNSSYNPGGGILTYAWNFGDPTSGSNTSTIANPSHTFTTTNSSPKKYVVKLTVTNNLGGTSVDSIIISVNNTPPVVNITSPVKNSLYVLGGDTVYQCQATVMDAEHPNGQLKYEWQTFLRHNIHEHAEPIDTFRNTSTAISRIGCNGETYYWIVKLKVTDAAGLSTMDSSKLFPGCTGALPLVLHSFSVAVQPNGNLIRWSTESETNLDSFVVERSVDGHQFYSINKQTAKGTIGQMQYSFFDNMYLPGNNYYRLRMVDKTTGWYFSLIIRVYNGTNRNDKLILIPNPVVNNFTLGGFFNTSGQVQIQITDANGRLIKSFFETVVSGFNNMLVNNLKHLQPGIYFVEVKEKETTRKTKFIKAQ